MKKSEEKKTENLWSFLKGIPPSKILIVVILICAALSFLIYMSIIRGADVRIGKSGLLFDSSENLRDKIKEQEKIIRSQKSEIKRVNNINSDLRQDLKKKFVKKPTLVTVMDSVYSTHVYNSQRRNPHVGGSNADEILGIIATEPGFIFQSELVNPSWKGINKLISTGTKVIIIHGSAFGDKMSAEKDYSILQNLIEKTNSDNNSTCFIVYSRDDTFKDQERILNVITGKSEKLKKKVQILFVPGPLYFLNKETRTKLINELNKTKELMGG